MDMGVLEDSFVDAAAAYGSRRASRIRLALRRRVARSVATRQHQSVAVGGKVPAVGRTWRSADRSLDTVRCARAVTEGPLVPNSLSAF